MTYYTRDRADAQALASLGIGFRADKASATLPASTTQDIFTITGGPVLVNLLYGVVTTIIQVQACNLSVSSTPTVGTAVVLASTFDINGKEAGTILRVEGDGTALVGANAGAGLSGIGLSPMIIPTGVISILTSATNTGATKWVCYWIPLEDGAVLA